jgi:hypothetical protein
MAPTCTKAAPYDPAHRAFPVAHCGGCNAEVQGKDWDESGKTAIAKWNTRASPLPAEEIGEELGEGDPAQVIEDMFLDAGETRCTCDRADGICRHCDKWARARTALRRALTIPSPATEQIAGNANCSAERETLERAALRRIAATDREEAGAFLCLDLIDIATEALASTLAQPEHEGRMSGAELAEFDDDQQLRNPERDLAARPEVQVSGDLVARHRHVQNSTLLPYFRALSKETADVLEQLTAHDARIKEALAGLVAGVKQHCNEPGGGGISGYLGARLSDAERVLGAAISNEGEGKL